MNKEENKKVEKPEVKKTQNKTTTKTKSVKTISQYKKDVEKLKKDITNLKKSNINLEAENQKNLIEFQSLAKTFQNKAQEQINAKIKEMTLKLDEEKIQIKKYGSQKLIESIVEPILNIEQAIDAGKKQDAVSAYVMGFEMLINQLYNELESFGVKSINPKSGEEFNPEEHYLFSHEEGGQKGKIKSVKKKGIKFHDRVIKPATIILGK